MQRNISFLVLLILILLFVSDAQKCPGLYKRFSSQHTFCLPANSTCSIVMQGVSEKDQQYIVQLHNEYRSKVATGQESYAGGMPYAANMLEMVWDEELALIAQKHAETCYYAHDCGNCRRVQAFSVGQNIGKISKISSPQSRADWQTFIKGLYDEVTHFNKSFIKPFIPGPHDEDTQYGHFTQMMWATSWRVGCGWALFKEEDLLTSYTVCNYGPGGNIVGGEMYKEGPTCSACPKNTCCGSSCDKHKLEAKFVGLCKVIEEFLPPEGAGPHEGNYLLYCDFNNQKDCKMTFTGKPWMMVRTPGGNWMSNILRSGERTRLTFNKQFDVQRDVCLKVLARSGPNVDGDIFSGEGVSMLDAGFTEVTYHLKNKNIEKENRQDFLKSSYGLGLPEGGQYQFQYSFNYSVPEGAPPQFVEIKEVSAREC